MLSQSFDGDEHVIPLAGIQMMTFAYLHANHVIIRGVIVFQALVVLQQQNPTHTFYRCFEPHPPAAPNRFAAASI